MRLNAALRAENGNRAIQYAKRTLDLYGEVNVARRVNDVDAVRAPVSGRRGGCNRNAALLLLNHIVHGGRAFMNLADLVNLACIIQDSLGRRGLACVNMRHDPDIAGFFK
ncbi:hypothetical protein SDC9_105769 [bioreactor metagenome]|uniref:Uncharacterized protein n=1 Tax=bioreactor metagenome TaxID=1076179 RepID=A0A645BB52_9ZZZZ